jgi:hypothetical protein
MAITDTEKLDFLWKKVGFAVAKTDSAANKLAFNEGTPSPLLIRGDKLWAQSGSIPTSIPTTSSSIVTVYKDGVGSWSSTVKCTEDLGATDNRTWKTNLTDWIPPELGSTYQITVYIDTTIAVAPQTTGTQIYAAGASNSSNDEWFFDYQAGVLNFIGVNLPTDIGSGVTGKSIYISGARYAGTFGVSTSIVSETANVGNLYLSNNTVSSTNTNGNIELDPNGTGQILLYANTTITGNLIVSGNANISANLDVAGTLSVNNFSVTGTMTIPDTNAGSVTASSIVTSTIISNDSNINIGTNTVIDSFPIANYRTAKYIIKASNSLGYESSEVLLVHDDSTSYITIYGVISTVVDDAAVVNITSNIVSGNVKVYASNVAPSTVVNFIGTYVKN